MTGNELIKEIQLFDKYSRFLPTKGRRETWSEVVERVVGFLRGQSPAVDEDTWTSISNAMLAQEVLPSMRIVQMAGPALERCHVGAYNCAYLPLDGPQALAELLYVMMAGTGVGFSVEQQYVDMWPQIVGTTGEDDFTNIYDIDDTTEGWCDAFLQAINHALKGNVIHFGYSNIRPKGQQLKTKGGVASGPEPLRKLLEQTIRIIRNRAGSKLTSFDIHRLATLAGSIVQVGGVRRAAQISLSDLNDSTMRDAKSGGDWWTEYPELAMANNSAVYSTKPGRLEFHREWTALKNSGSGERGIFNRKFAVTNAPRRRGVAQISNIEWNGEFGSITYEYHTSKTPAYGVNPCGEIVLRPRQFCNLSIAVARPTDTVESLTEKVRLATILGTIQSTLTNFRYLPPEWAKNCNEERLLGVDITGTMDCPLLNDVSADVQLFLARLKQEALRTNKEWAKKLNINQSVAVTCNKPSGNSSQLLDCSSGIHARYAPYYIRRIRLASQSPLSKRLIELGVIHHIEMDSDLFVFEIPVVSPSNSIMRADMTARLQFEYWLQWKQHWTEHNPSTTIYVREHEWNEMEQLVWDNWEKVGGLSFLPYSDHVYKLAPYEEISKEEYDRLVEHLPTDIGEIIESSDHTTVAGDFSCVGDICVI